jgi:hypothetical protein
MKECYPPPSPSTDLENTHNLPEKVGPTDTAVTAAPSEWFAELRISSRFGPWLRIKGKFYKRWGGTRNNQT